MAQSVGAVEYTDCISTEGQNSPDECPEYYTKQYDGNVSLMQKVWRILSTALLPSLPGLIWPRVVTPDRVLPMSQIELKYVLMLNWIVWN